METKWDEFVGKSRPNRAGKKKLDAFNALFQVFSKEKSKALEGMMAAQAGKEEEEKEDTAAVGDLTVAFEENLFLSRGRGRGRGTRQACDPTRADTSHWDVQ